MSKTVKKYRLFAVLHTADNVDYASSFRFSRVTTDYILIFEQRKKLNPPDGMYAELAKEEDLKKLSEQDRQWLDDCVRFIFFNIVANHSKNDVERLTNMVSRLEEELEIESQREGDDT